MIYLLLAFLASLLAILAMERHSRRRHVDASGWTPLPGRVVELGGAGGSPRGVVAYPLDHDHVNTFVAPLPVGTRLGAHVEVLVDPDNPHAAHLAPGNSSVRLARGTLLGVAAYLVSALLGAALLLQVVARLAD